MNIRSGQQIGVKKYEGLAQHLHGCIEAVS